MPYTLIRNATAVLDTGGTRFLIDPMLDPAGHRPAIPNTPNQQPNPLVDLPAGWEQMIAAPDALVVTHLHQDHFDDTAVRSLDRSLPVFCQPEDIDRLREHGFNDLQPVNHEATFGEVSITRTGGRHGTGEIGRALAPVSGFVFASPGEPTVYIAGDTIWCDEVAQAIATHRPQVIVVNASGARFLTGDPIVMTAGDIANVRADAPEALIILVHLEAINHCLETRSYLRDALPALGVAMDRIRIPGDGATVDFSTN